MKKLIYIVIISFVTSLSVTSCTEEEIKPSTSFSGGNASTDKGF